MIERLIAEFLQHDLQLVIDGRVIGTGELGPVTARIRELYKSLVNA